MQLQCKDGDRKMEKIYHGDCLKTMALLEPDSVDMLFTDLPYGSTKCAWDTPIDLAEFWKQANRVVKKNGAVVLFAKTPFDKVLGGSNIKHLKYEWIWEKNQATGHFNARFMPMQAHENILVFYRKKPTYHPQMTKGHKPVNSYTKYVETQNKSGLYGKAKQEVRGDGSTVRHPRTVLKGPSDKQTSHLHPTQKPVWLCRHMVLTYTDVGDTVLDCCMGSASIGIACQDTGRRYIGIEKDREWYEVSRDRLLNHCRYDRGQRVVECEGEF